MKSWVRWLLLTGVTSVAIFVTAALIYTVEGQETAADVSDEARPKLEQQSALLARLEPDLAKALAAAAPDERLNVIVEMQKTVDLAPLSWEKQTDPTDRRRRLVDALQTTAERTQVDVRAFLDAQRRAGKVTRVIPFWIFNGLAVHGARPDAVRALATRPDVALIRLDHRRQWIDAEPEAGPGGYEPHSAGIEWGIARIRADEVWHTLGVSGTGVVVANMDTGVDWQHPALQANYRGYDPKGFHQHEGNWHDATGADALYPVDGHSHGSHTMGTLVGQGGIGVAPGAQWIAVRVFDQTGTGYDSWIHAGFEWLLAPAGNPDLAPQVVNNSWGSTAGYRTVFQNDLDALRAAGILAVFSSGNNGPNPGTVGSPASLPGAFAVGASDQDDEVASFSSRGPSPWGEVRPHLVAPGVNVNSTAPGGTYQIKQGTSMAAPHVAGTAALMLSARPGLNITQTTYILTHNAIPLTHAVPNNDSGYGRLDAHAAVASALEAGLLSGAIRGDGRPLPGATIRAKALSGDLQGTTTSRADGSYQLFLGAGQYDVTASAFGYTSDWVHAVSIVTGENTVQVFDLTALPTGSLRGTVRGSGGQTVEAQVSVLGTPVTTTADGGAYDLTLPGGSYTLEARALGYRVVTASVTVTVGQNVQQDLLLPESLRLLLVDGGSRYYQSQATYYRQALDDLAFAYDQRRLKHLPADVPTTDTLRAYDLVIWSAPDDSPRLVGAGEVITDYLHGGGNLLLSGQDVAYWDGGGRGGLHPYYADFAHSVFLADNAPSRQVSCRRDSPFNGITLTIQEGDGADNQRWPDEIGVYHPDHATQVCSYEEGRGAVIQAGFCDAHRALNLGFGFEAINDASDRAAFMDSALDWFVSPRQTAGVELLRQSDPVQIAPPGNVTTHILRLRNLGEAGPGDRFEIEVSGAEWPVSVSTPTVELQACATALVRLQVETPVDAPGNSFDAMTLTARSSVSPTLSQSLVLTSKVPAPVLLVDDDRWYDQEPAYEKALRAAGLPYDYWEVEPRGIFGQGSPPASVLAWYPTVLWFTGYDWFDPIHPNELDRLTGYLDQGGRLFLSSQEYLFRVGSAALTRDYFGIVEHSEWLSQTTVWGVPDHALGDGLGPVDLSYPYRNWSDSVLPDLGTQVAFRGQHGQPGAVTREGTCSSGTGIGTPGCRWRTAFFAFPFEALPADVREELMSRLVGWLSWLGASTLQADRETAQVGESVGYTLTLRNDGQATVVGATVSNRLPDPTVLVNGPEGGASYDPAQHRVTWQGDLAPGAALTFTYQLSLTGGTAPGTVNNRATITLPEQGLHFQRQARVRIAAPDLSTSYWIMPKEIAPFRELTVTLALRNDGLAEAPLARLDNPLPWPMWLVSGTLSVDGGGTALELPRENRVRWEGKLGIGEPTTLTYRVFTLSFSQEPIWAYNAARLEDGVGGAWERGSWLHVRYLRFYFPVLVTTRP